ncbi:membrane lipoprotein lipid attachment site-containing protein [Halobacillus sp. Cin3]|uniref:membrane lipoprotein lipid attachment site-containing protein n=1 Tax=Halobacillus sp. Cin3 TaxID=2928441 RepID=UPI00248E0C4E|nr:membrane lipoprotein lipid attachment site-containing protein [Halobacillus sp. Cin3]
MKKIILYLFIVTLVLAGCANESIMLSGESSNWEGEYSADNGPDTEYGEFTFHYKKDEELKNLKITISEEETIQTWEKLDKRTVTISSQCSGCTPETGEPIQVEIQWGRPQQTEKLTLE